MVSAKKSADFTVPTTAVDSRKAVVSQTLPGDSAWLTGAATLGALLLGILLLRGDYNSGTAWFDTAAMASSTQTALAILLAALAAMVAVENWRSWRFHTPGLFHRAPAWDANFFAVGLLRYLEHLVLLWLIQLFYRTADEYGFTAKHPFYQPWHQLLDVFFTVYIWLGLPYVLLTRAFLWRDEAERRDYGLLLELGFWSLIKRLPRTSHWFSDHKVAAIPGRTIFLDLLVKMFFLPLLLVFFCDQLSHLVNNLNYLAGGMPKAYSNGQWQHTQWNFDVANFLISLLFTLHTGLAFCAIAIGQRWLPRPGIANPRLSGWLACLLTFPPFIHMIITNHLNGVTGPHLDGPSSVLAQLPNQWLFTGAIFAMGLFYTGYLLATVNLGAHFCELTNRGLVRTGLYARVRHPAYATKLLGWLCILAPLLGLNMFDGNWTVAGGLAGAYVIGVVIYYWRALTEEQHLGEDPEYQEYCRHVRWRFIPGVW